MREALMQGGFSSDDPLLDSEEASKVLQVSPDWLTTTLANYRSHGGSGRKRYAFPIEGSRRGFGGMSACSFSEMVSRMPSRLSQPTKSVSSISGASTLQQKISILFSEVGVG
jgi:hypothetical protein